MAANGDELRKVAIVVLGAVLITNMLCLTVVVTVTSRDVDAAVKWSTIGMVAIALVAAGPIIVLRPQHRDRYRDRDTPPE